MRFLPGAAALLLVALAGTPALAHAFLERASPRVGARVITAPAEVRLTFTEPLEADFCRVSVAGPAGFAGAGAPAAASGDRRSLLVPLRRPAPPGRYLVRWRVVSADSHVSQGEFHFDIAP